MAHKRFTDIDKWKDEWFLELSKDEKLIWLYILDNCTNAGRWKLSIKHLNFCCDTGLNEAEIGKFLNGRAIKKEGYYFIPKFLKFQYPNTLNSDKKALIAVRQELIEYKLSKYVNDLYGDSYLDLSISDSSPIDKQSIQEKDKDKDKDKDKEKRKEKDSDIAEIFETIYQEYPKKLGKDDAQKHFISQYKNAENKLFFIANITRAIVNYKEYIIKQKIEYAYIKYASGFFNKLWKDFVVVQQTKIVDKSAEVLKKVAEKVHDEKEKLKKLMDDPEYISKGKEAFSKIKKLGGAK